jgi:anti-sigma B factor antagonist
MTVEIRQEAGVTLVRLAGAVQLVDAEELGAQVDTLLAGPTRHILFDLSALEFLSSVGIAAFVRAHRALKEHGGSVRLVNPRPPIANLLRLTRVSELIPIHASLETARQAVASQ